MKRIALAAVVIGAAVATGYWKYPEEFEMYKGMAMDGARWVRESIEANPGPVAFALGTFVLTVLYHKAKGKSLRESVEVAATRVTVVPVAINDGGEDEHPVVRRARARAMRAQLLTDRNGIENRQRKLPDEVLKAEKEACYTEQALADAERKLAETQNRHETAVARLEALRKEKAQSEAELAEIESELKRLAELA